MEESLKSLHFFFPFLKKLAAEQLEKTPNTTSSSITNEKPRTETLRHGPYYSFALHTHFLLLNANVHVLLFVLF